MTVDMSERGVSALLWAVLAVVWMQQDTVGGETVVEEGVVTVIIEWLDRSESEESENQSSSLFD